MKKTISILILSLLPIIVTSCVDGVKYLDCNTKIGNQKWMSENLNTSYCRNGDKIPEAKTDHEWLANGEHENENTANNDDYKEAIQIYKKVVEIDPTCARAYYELGRCFYKLEKYKEACNNLQKCS